jgi:hypothetical protein
MNVHPAYSEEEVQTFVTELLAGASPLIAYYAIRPTTDHETAVVEAAHLVTRDETREAFRKLYGGDFDGMTKEQAINAAIAKSLREMAYYIWTNYFEHLDGLRMKKYTDAFMTLTKWFPPTEAGTDSPVHDFWKKFFDEKKPAQEREI